MMNDVQRLDESATIPPGEILEISVETDSEAAEAVCELFNRFNGGGYEDDSEAGEAGGGELVARLLAGLEGLLQPITERHELVDLGDDPMLFGVRGKRHGDAIHTILGQAASSSAGLLANQALRCGCIDTQCGQP